MAWRTASRSWASSSWFRSRIHAPRIRTKRSERAGCSATCGYALVLRPGGSQLPTLDGVDAYRSSTSAPATIPQRNPRHHLSSSPAQPANPRMLGGRDRRSDVSLPHPPDSPPSIGNVARIG